MSPGNDFYVDLSLCISKDSNYFLSAKLTKNFKDRSVIIDDVIYDVPISVGKFNGIDKLIDSRRNIEFNIAIYKDAGVKILKFLKSFDFLKYISFLETNTCYLDTTIFKDPNFIPKYSNVIIPNSFLIGKYYDIPYMLDLKSNNDFVFTFTNWPLYHGKWYIEGNRIVLNSTDPKLTVKGYILNSKMIAFKNIPGYALKWLTISNYPRL